MAGFILWRGTSLLDGVSPVAVFVTLGSVNRKTGDMDQAWILRTDVHPWHAARTGQDAAICGACRHRGPSKTRSCYVSVQHGPAAIYRAYLADETRPGPRLYPTKYGHDAARALAGRFLRIGAYGDPAAVPVWAWEPLFDRLAGWTGYTHQWRTCDRSYKRFLMASVDSQDERAEAQALGWRTFRVRLTAALLPGEIVCPASREAGHRLTCVQCRICSGHSGRNAGRDVAIYSHGQGEARFFRSAQAALMFHVEHSEDEANPIA